MSKIKVRIGYLLMISLFAACTGSKEDEKIIEQSIKVHEEAMKMGSKASDKIVQIEGIAKDLEEPMMSAIMDSVENLKSAWKAWDETIVEVPGHEDHDHEHHHDHDLHVQEHHHESTPDLTPEMVLEVQEEIKKRAYELDLRVQNVLDILTKE